MAVVINGTTGITSVNGSASAPSVTGTDTDTGIVYGTNTLSLSTGGTTAVTVDSSQNVGIGTNSPSVKLDVIGNTRTAQSDTSDAYFRTQNSFGSTYYLQKSDRATIYTPTTQPFTFDIAGGERMRIDSSGNVGIGTSSPSKKLEVGALGAFRLQTGSTTMDCTPTAGATDGFVWNTSASSYYDWAYSGTSKMRLDPSGNLLVGHTAKGGTTATGHVAANAYACKAGIGAALGGNVFNINWTGTPQLWIDATNVGTITVTSDYRVKQNVETQIAPALDRVMQLRPVTYELKDYGTLYKADGVAREGFIAHELQAIIPSSVEGEKDAENQIQSLKLDALCSVLTKAIQEQQAIIEQLRADVEQLKGQA